MPTLEHAQSAAGASDWRSLTLAASAALPAGEVLARLESTAEGLPAGEAQERLALIGSNALRSHAARPLEVLVRQLRNPLLVLLVAASLTSFAVGEPTTALIICLSVGLGFFCSPTGPAR